MNGPTIKDQEWLVACDRMAEIKYRCGKKQYWAFVIDILGRVRGAGYNGTPAGMTNCTDGGCPRYLNNVPSGTPYDFGDGLCYSVHAEDNALQGVDRLHLESGTLYVNGTCCVGCAKKIANSGLGRVVCYAENRPDTDIVRYIFDSVGIEFHEVLRETPSSMASVTLLPTPTH
jgi:dCMP deaminase